MKRKPFNPAQAIVEGWTLEDSEILPQGEVFGARGHAIAFVRQKADDGSSYHTDALRRAGLL